MLEKPSDPRKASEAQCAGKQSRSQEAADTLADPNERRQLVIKSLLETLPAGVDEKLTTVKAAHHVDKDRFQSAFRSLMRNGKP